MTIYFYWGEDDFAIARAIASLRDRTLDPHWTGFNYEKIPADRTDAVVQGLDLALTPPFGAGKRLVWLVDTALAQQCSNDLLTELERTLPIIPETTVLLMTSRTKPDGRLKSTKLLKDCAEIQEFSPLPPWKTEQLVQRVRQVAQAVDVRLTVPATEYVAEAVGNNTRQLYMELEKLKLFAGRERRLLDVEAIAPLITATTQNSLKLATAIRQGKVALALELVEGLVRQNEPSLKIVTTLVNQFRTWLWVKLLLEAGERDERTIAEAAEINNPKRIYFLQQEVKVLSLQQLQKTLPLLLELEFSLKQGAEEQLTLQTKVIELCQICSQR